MANKSIIRVIWFLFAILPVLHSSRISAQTITIPMQASTNNADRLTVPGITLSGTNQICPGSSNGSITAVITSDDGPFSTSWTGPGGFTSTQQNLTNLAAGTYTLTSCNNSGCATADFTISERPPILVLMDAVPVTCNGGSNGEASAFVVSDGVFTYLWNTGATSAGITGLTAGTYTVTITNAGTGCTQTETITVTQPDPITINLSPFDPNCNGGTNGLVASTVIGGTPPYSYLWNTGATTPDLVDVAAGTYTLTVTDANGCTNTSSATLNNPPPLVLSFTSTPSSCLGAPTGSATVSVVSGGLPPYNYTWSNGATTASITNLAAGTYSVTVSDERACSATGSVTITAPASFTLSVSTTNVTCASGTNGTATANITGGASPFTYLWSNGANTASVSNLSAGNYDVTVTDASGCQQTALFVITQPTLVGITPNSTNVSCNGGTNGTASVIVEGGSPPYSYLWNTGATTSSISGLAAGSYQVTVTDSHGCTNSTEIVITQPAPVSLTFSTTPDGCSPANTGTATVIAEGGTSGYTYLWSNGATTSTISGLAPGVYSVTVTDASGCTGTGSATVAAAAAITVTPTSTNVTCNGGNNGAAAVTVTGGTPSYTYLWNNGATTAAISGLTAGTYSVTVTDASGCTGTASVTITQPTTLQLNFNNTSPSCNGGTNGAASVTVTGGTPGYTYLWSNGATTAAITNQVAGTYSVTVTDANGCTQNGSVTISQPTVINLTLSSNPVTCNGGNNGSATVAASGGTPGYTYLWSTGATTATITGLAAGTYSVTVTDANGCIKTGSVTVNQPSAIQLNFTSGTVSCNGGNNGSATVAASGGTPGYTYLWSNGATTAAISGLTAGTYSVTVTDASACIKTGSVTINEPTALTANTTFTNVSCNGGSNGTASVTSVSGGTPGYTYLWSTGATTAAVSGLVAGTYTVTVRDANNCSINRAVTITQPAAITVTPTAINLTCNGAANGSVSLVVSGGTPGYTYLWNTGATTATISGLVAGNYSVIVRDANNCTGIAAVTITQPAVLSVTTAATAVSCNGGNNGTVSATVSGGTTPYTYLWSNGATTASVTGLTAGTYSVTIRDANNCTTAGSVTVSQPTPIVITGTASNPLCSGACNGSILLTVTGGTAPYTYLWSNGATTKDITNLCAATYSVTVRDANNCTASYSATLTNPAPISVNLGPDKTLCLNQTYSLDGTIATPGSTYQWTSTNGFTANTPVVTLTQAGTYTLTVTTPAGCQASDNIIITTSTSPISSDFVVATQAFQNEVVTLVNIANPRPDNITWQIPSTSAITVRSSNTVYAELVFNQTGTYFVGMRSQVGSCESITTKKVIVLDPQVFPPPGRIQDPLIQLYTITPNPSNGQFAVRVTLREITGIRLRLVSLISNAVVSDRTLNGSRDYTVPYSITLPAGVYVMSLETPTSSRVFKVLIN